MKFLPILIASFLLQSLLAQDCNNPLLGVFNITGLPTPQSGADLPYCGNLQSGTTCCSVDTVAGFQYLVNNLTANLQGIAALKDDYINQLNNNFTNQFQQAANDIQQFSDDIANLVSVDADIGNTFQDQYNLFQSISQELNDIASNFNNSLSIYQQDRAACFSTLLQIQSSAWCLACDPNYANEGVQANGTINPDASICSVIQTNCTGFTLQSDYFSPLFQAQQVFNRLVNISSYIQNFTNGNNIIPDIVLNNDVYNPLNYIEQSVSLPAQCNTSNCTWLCNSLFSPQFLLNIPLVADGAGLVGGRDIQLDPIGVLLANTTNNTISPNGSVTCSNCSVTPDNITAPNPLSQWNPNLNITGLSFNITQTPTLPSLNFTQYLLSAVLPNLTEDINNTFPNNYGLAIPIPTDVNLTITTTNTTTTTTTTNTTVTNSTGGVVSGSENGENNNEEVVIGTEAEIETVTIVGEGSEEVAIGTETEIGTEAEIETVTIVGEGSEEAQTGESEESSVVVITVPTGEESAEEDLGDGTTVTVITEVVNSHENSDDDDSHGSSSEESIVVTVPEEDSSTTSTSTTPTKPSGGSGKPTGGSHSSSSSSSSSSWSSWSSSSSS